MLSDLFSPIKIRDLKIQNRIMMSPMCQYSANDGVLNEWHFVHYATRAIGQVGLIMLESTAISPEGRISPWDLGIWSENHVKPLRNFVNFLKEQNAIPAIQLSHAGRKGSTSQPWNGPIPLPENKNGWKVLAPSPIPFLDNGKIPHELSEKEIEEIIFKFTEAAQRALEIGFQIVEIHAAHGYLIHEFLSPISNKRTDIYGGSLENRQRLLLKIAKEVRKVWPQELPVFTRISATDWVEGGWSVSESIDTAKKLKEIGIDVIDVSSGGNIANFQIEETLGYQVGFSESIKKEADILTTAVGKIITPHQAEEILKNKKADIIALGRELLRNPYWAYNAAKELESEINWPNQYLRAKP